MVNTSVFVIPTDDPVQARAAEAHVRQQLSFYMSTRPKVILALHGWEAVGDSSRWAWAAVDEMGRLITDEMIDTFAVTGRWIQLPKSSTLATAICWTASATTCPLNRASTTPTGATPSTGLKAGTTPPADIPARRAALTGSWDFSVAAGKLVTIKC